KHTCQNATRPFTSSMCSHSRGPVRCCVGEPGSASRGRCPTVHPEDRAGVRSGALILTYAAERSCGRSQGAAVLREKAKSSGRDPELLGEPHPSLCGGKVSLAASTASGPFGSIGHTSRFPVDLVFAGCLM